MRTKKAAIPFWCAGRPEIALIQIIRSDVSIRCRSPLECVVLSVAKGERAAADEQYILLEQAADVLEICQAHIFDNDNANGGGFSAKALAGAIGLAAGVVRVYNQITEAQARHETRVQFSRGCAK